MRLFSRGFFVPNVRRISSPARESGLDIALDIAALMKQGPIKTDEIEKKLRSSEGRGVLRDVLSATISMEAPVAKGRLLDLAISRADFSLVKTLIGFDATIDDNALKLAQQSTQQNESGQEQKKIFAFLNSRKDNKLSYISEHRWQAVQSPKVSLSRVLRLLEEIKELDLSHIPEPAKFFLLCGHTQEGKSTLGNYLLGANYSLRADEKDMLHADLNPPTLQQTFTTGGHGCSETWFPKAERWGQHVLVDMPGFGEGRGPEESIAISASTKWFSKELANRNAKIAGILFICDYGQLTSAVMGTFPYSANLLGKIAETEQARKHIYLLATKPRCDTASKKAVLANLSAFVNRPTNQHECDKDATKLAEAILGGYILGGQNPSLLLADITAPETRETIGSWREHIAGFDQPQFAIQKLYDESLYGNYNAMLDEAFTKAIEFHRRLQLEVVRSGNVLGQARTAYHLAEKKCADKKAELSQFCSTKNQQAQKDCTADKEALDAAITIIKRRLKQISDEIDRLTSERERLSQDETHTAVEPHEVNFDVGITQRTNTTITPVSYIEWGGQERTLIRLQITRPYPISSWKIASIYNCKLIPGYFHHPSEEFVPCAGEFDATGKVFISEKNHAKTYLSELNKNGRIEGVVAGETRGPARVTFELTSPKKDHPDTKKHIDEIDKRIAALNARLCAANNDYLTWTVEWLISEMTFCEKELAELQSSKVYHDKLQSDVTITESESIESAKSALEESAHLEAFSKLELDVNKDYFNRIQKLIRIFGLDRHHRDFLACNFSTPPVEPDSADSLGPRLR
jgi:hypothetical protein